MELQDLTIAQLNGMLKNKKISAQEIVNITLNHIEGMDAKIGAYLRVTKERALASAIEIDKTLQKGEDVGPLAGIPMAIKDNICTEGIKTTCGSKILEDYVPPYNATAYEKLLRMGALMMGKTNLDEFAMGSSTENSAFQITKNPWALDRVPGGSSGGSAAAVAAGEAFFALGSDTGGSVRQPAAFCGVVGLKPTYGLVSRYGLVAFASSLDQIGIMTRNVEDCAKVLQGIAGRDHKDATSCSAVEINYSRFLGHPIRGIRLGVPKEWLETLPAYLKETLLRALERLTDLGAEWKLISIPSLKYGLASYHVISSAEASSNLARFDGIRYGFRSSSYESIEDLMIKTRSKGFGREVKRKIMVGTYMLSKGYDDHFYEKALKMRKILKKELESILTRFHGLIGLTTGSTAFSLGEKVDDPLAMYSGDLYTVPANLAGLPALSLPWGFSEGLPLGIQLMGRAFEEDVLLQIAYQLEGKGIWKQHRPFKGGIDFGI